MNKNFTPMNPLEWNESAFRVIGKEWMLITAGSADSYNTMTASWGGFGELWARPVCFIVIRPQRFTREFVDREEFFTLSFFKTEQKGILQFCGANSGREVDKAAATGLTTATTRLGSVYFNEASRVLECRKIYHHDLDPENFMNADIDQYYPQKDWHRMYVGEVVSALEAP
jgi:flavin reductase (DIM6/NTAB) family NADH-FMN oxidoreductase RutF